MFPAPPAVHVRAAVRTLPAYVPGARPDGDHVVKLSSNELPYPPQEKVVQAAAAAAAQANRYPEMTGQTLVDALAERHGVDSARIVVGGGSVALISHLVGTVWDAGDDVVMPGRAVEAYPRCVTAAGARPLGVPLTVDGRHDVPALLEAVTPRTRLLMACTPNNPTGAALSAVELQALLDGVPEDVAVLVDEAYLDFVTDPDVGDALELIDEYPNLVVSRTFSKAHALAGLRVGYLVGEAVLMDAVRRVATPFGVSLPAQAAALASLEAHVLEETASRAAQVASERDRVVAVLREQGWTVPDTQGNFYWLGVGGQAMALADHMEQAGVLVRPFIEEGVRVSVGLPEDNDRALAALAAFPDRPCLPAPVPPAPAGQADETETD